MPKPRKYGLFVKRGHRWHRLYPTLAFYKESAVRYFQDDLLTGKYELRPVKDAKLNWYEKLGA